MFDAISMDWTGLKEAVSALTDAGKRQIPFAHALALTLTAKDIQTFEREKGIRRDFTVRTPWVAKGIRFGKATKQNLEAWVGSKDKFMRLQALGGIKSAGNKAMGVPVDIRIPETRVIAKKIWPGALMKKKKGGEGYFEGKLPGANFKYGLWHRAAGVARYPITLMYIFRERVRITKHWDFYKDADVIAKKQWPKNAKEALKRALKTAR